MSLIHMSDFTFDLYSLLVVIGVMLANMREFPNGFTFWPKLNSSAMLNCREIEKEATTRVG